VFFFVWLVLLELKIHMLMVSTVFAIEFGFFKYNK